MATRTKTNSSPDQPALRIQFDRFELDEAEARLTVDGQAVPLPPKPFAVLCALARAPQKLVSTNELLDQVWGHRYVSESVLKSAISDLRALLRDDPKEPRYIETISRRGYRFIAKVGVSSLARASMRSPSTTGTQSSVSISIGRLNELERLRTAWSRAATGKRQVVWIAGEAGVGKTTLIERFIEEIGETRCAYGHCIDQRDAGEPYLPVLEALTVLCRRDTALADLIRAVAPSWLLRLPWLCSAAEREALRLELSGAGETRMMREMGELLDRYAQDRPLLLVTEDLHWSDSATVQLINYLARRRGNGRVVWLASFRLTELIAADHAFNSVRRELRLHDLCEEIVLDAFSESEVAEYVAQHAPALVANEEFVRALHDRTDGLPLFVADVLGDLIAQGRDWKSVRLNAARPIPESLTAIVERYADQLTTEQRLALEVASVCGAEFRVATVARMLNTDVASIAELCAELARRQRWLKDVPSSRHGTAVDAQYAFRHALYREVLYKRIGCVARDELHRKLGGVEHGPGMADVIALSRPEIAA